MAKGKAKRPSMGDALVRMGELNAARPAVEPETVAEPVVEAVEPDTGPEPEPEPAAAVEVGPAVEPVHPAKPETGSTRARSHVEKERRAQQTRPASVPKGYNVRPPRIEKPHQSIYADPAVFRVIRQIAAAEDVKPQDLYREALRALLKKRGFDFDKLDRGEA